MIIRNRNSPEIDGGPSPEERQEIADDLDRRTIFRSEVGSTAHGITHASNDIDQIAIYIPTIEETINFSTDGAAREESFTWRPGRQPDEPSGPGDLDRVYHSLGKFVGLLIKGNPSILFALFGTDQHTHLLGDELLHYRGQFATVETRNAYIGYMDRQRERITGARGAAGRMRRSPEGGGEVDWKYAMHMLRLGVQGFEYLTTGHISAPSVDRDILLAVRSGEIPLDEVIQASIDQREMLMRLDLPSNSYGVIEQWSQRVNTWYSEAWRRGFA